MSGNPDVLEYYQSKNSKKPIRVIDLKECEVEMLNGQLRIQRDFHGKHLFVVKTSFRAFYLVAKTEEEMNGWISSISQICHFGSTEDAGKHTPETSEGPVVWDLAASSGEVANFNCQNTPRLTLPNREWARLHIFSSYFFEPITIVLGQPRLEPLSCWGGGLVLHTGR